VTGAADAHRRTVPGVPAVTPTRCVVLLRGINLGRHNRLSMPDLRAALEDVGCRDVQTYVQSGNAVVDWTGEPAELERATREQLSARGLDVPVMVRTGPELARVVAGSPWTGLDPKLFHVAFLSGQPDPAAVAAIDHEALLPERVVVGERVLYLDHATGVRGSRLDRLRLGVDATARNWRTTTALLALVEPAGVPGPAASTG
jgi:uncharacterized protein (DUF1697 family)